MYAALGEPIRLAITDDLATSDRSPGELARRLGLAPSLLAHHLDVLEHVGLLERFASTGDRRRKYVRLTPGTDPVGPRRSTPGAGVLFVCTHNSARSQLAAALWTSRIGSKATSAGTHPAERGRIFGICLLGLDLGGAIAAPLFGAIANQLGYRPIFAIGAAMVFSALALFLTRTNANLGQSLRFALGQGLLDELRP